MDNFKIDIVSEKREAFDLAMRLAFTGDSFSEKKAKAWVTDPAKGLVFLWAEENGSTNFPFPLHWQDCAGIAWKWLEQMERQEYPKEPDHDGSNSRGFNIYNEAWGHVGGWRYSIVAVKPEWCMYGK